MSATGDLRAEPGVIAPLTERECYDLLRAGRFGRVGITSGGLPAILPVRYVYDDTAIAFRTGDGAKLRAARSGDVLAFEIDDYDDENGDGWSVLVLGRASVSTMDSDHCVRLSCEMISGRRVTHNG